MTIADRIRQMDDMQLADYLCFISDSQCENCKFGKCGTECAAMKYLKKESVDGERLP